MALNASLVSRSRSITTASRGLNTDEEISRTVELCRQLHTRPPLRDEGDLEATVSIALELKEDLTANAASKDVFRRGGGFEKVLTVVENICNHEVEGEFQNLADTVSVVGSLLSLLSTAFHEHFGNERYFENRLDGWTRLRKNLLALYRAPDDLDQDLHSQHEARSTLIVNILALALGQNDGDHLVNEFKRLSSAGLTDERAFSALLKGHESVTHPHAWSLATAMILDTNIVGGADVQSPDARHFLYLVSAATKLSIRNQVHLWETGITGDLLNHYFNRASQPAQRTALKRLIDLLAPLGLSDLDLSLIHI